MKREIVVFGALLVVMATGCQKSQPPKTSGGPAGNRTVAVKSVKVANVWHTLSVEARGDHFVVTFDGKSALDARDGTFEGAGKVGLWTKAGSVIAFDTLTITGR